MPEQSLLVLAAVVAVFIVFAMSLGYASRVSGRL